MDLYEDGKLRGGITDNVFEFLPFVLQFCFGGLFSAFVIFYSKSASLFSNSAFVLVLVSLLIGNEFFKKHYSKLIFQIAIYFVALFSFLIYFLPVLIKQMGAMIFIFSGFISLIFIGFFIFIVYFLTPELYKKSYQSLLLVILGLYTLINVLYFTNIIPPIPLSLKIADVYHRIEKDVNANYVVTGEKNSWREKFGLSQKIYLQEGEPVYIFSSIFAPTDLNLSIMHDWQYYDANDGWVSASKIVFPMKGGRDEGYRGFSMKENIFRGEWRVDIKTEKGQSIGRVRFDIENGTPPKPLETKTI